jgi:hypothetical protein
MVIALRYTGLSAANWSNGMPAAWMVQKKAAVAAAAWIPPRNRNRATSEAENKGWVRRLGGAFMVPRSGGSAPSASAGRTSEPRSMASICRVVMGTCGKPANVAARMGTSSPTLELNT